MVLKLSNICRIHVDRYLVLVFNDSFYVHFVYFGLFLKHFKLFVVL